MMIIAFTIGHTKSYNKALADDSHNCFKTGRREDYEGGWIWKTAEEADDFIKSTEFMNVDWGDGNPRNPNDFSVFKVILVNGWEKDVSAIPGKDNIFHLLVDSKFMAL